MSNLSNLESVALMVLGDYERLLISISWSSLFIVIIGWWSMKEIFLSPELSYDLISLVCLSLIDPFLEEFFFSS